VGGSEVKPKRVLKNVVVKGVAITEPSQGKAASGLNDPLLLKAGEKKPLTDNMKRLLVSFGREESDLEKAKSDSNQTDCPSAEEIEKTNLNNEGNKEDMSEDVTLLKSQLEAALAELAVERVEKSLSKYSFVEADAGELAKALVPLTADQRKVVFKALDTLNEKANTEKAPKDELINKATETPNPLAATLSKEAGEAGEVDLSKADDPKVRLKDAINKAYAERGIK
jgi:hypothetical protein